VTVRLSKGRAFSERVDYPRGHARNPLTDAEVEAKFHSLADAVLSRERADLVLRSWWRLDAACDWHTLVSSLAVSG
jgi:2-methylcitrate dehydratase